MDTVKFLQERKRMHESGAIAPSVMQKGDTIKARFMTLPSEYPGSGANDEKRFPVRKGTVVYVHPKGRYIVAECGGVRETFFPEQILTVR